MFNFTPASKILVGSAAIYMGASSIEVSASDFRNMMVDIEQVLADTTMNQQQKKEARHDARVRFAKTVVLKNAWSLGLLFIGGVLVGRGIRGYEDMVRELVSQTEKFELMGEAGMKMLVNSANALYQETGDSKLVRTVFLEQPSVNGYKLHFVFNK